MKYAANMDSKVLEPSSPSLPGSPKATHALTARRFPRKRDTWK